MIRITQFEAMREIDFDGKDPRIELKRMRIQAKNKVDRQIYTQLSDGSVPSFNEFQAIKKQLTDKQSTALTLSEQRREDIKQYHELESMATEKNSARINKLQKDLPSFKQQNSIFMTPDGHKVDSLENLPPSQNFVITTDGKPADLPYDVTMKSVAELKRLGFSEEMSMDFKPNKRTGMMQPNISAAERHKMLSSIGIEQPPEDWDEDDPAYFKDIIRDKMDSNPSEEKILQKKLLRQKQIDDRRIGIVFEALTNGVELKGNKLYYQLLDNYPHFQKTFTHKKKKVKEAKRLRAPVSKSAKVIDTEVVDQSKFAYYENLLAEYEALETRLNTEMDNMPEDVFTERDREEIIR